MGRCVVGMIVDRTESQDMFIADNLGSNYLFLLISTNTDSGVDVKDGD